MDFNSDEELDKLLLLLATSEPIEENHPFLLFLKSTGLRPGIKLVKLEQHILAYRRFNRKKIAEKKCLKLLGGYLDYVGIRGIPYLKVNKVIKGCKEYRGKIPGDKTKKARYRKVSRS